MAAEKHLLEDIEWQLFCTFTFRRLDVSEAVWLKMFFAMMREQADNLGVHFLKVMWALRYELGEITGRPHFHSLIAGLPNSAIQVRTCMSFMKIWERHGGGIGRVRVYDPTLAGVDYVLGGIDEAYSLVRGNWYELKKFGGRCDVMLSMKLIRYLENRRRFGHRDRNGLFSGGRRHYLPRWQKLRAEMKGTDTPATTRQGAVSGRSFNNSVPSHSTGDNGGYSS